MDLNIWLAENWVSHFVPSAAIMETLLEKVQDIDFPRPSMREVFVPADQWMIENKSTCERDRRLQERVALDVLFGKLTEFSFPEGLLATRRLFCTMNRYSRSKPPPCLGVIGVTDDQFAFSNASWYYSYVVKAKARRHDQVKSAYDVWHSERQQILELAQVSFRAYFPDQRLEDQSKQVIEDECFFRLRQLGGPGLFPAVLAVGFMKHFRARKILDLAAGWGDRLLAACAVKAAYVGADPNPELVGVHRNIIDHWGDSTRQTVICQPFEDIVWSERDYGTFDFMLSSPPFHNLEVYSNDPTQCSERYKSTQRFLEGFLFPSLTKCDKLLALNANVIIHLNDIVCFGRPQDNEPLVEAMVLFCTRKLGWQIQGQWGFSALKEMRQRDDSGPRVDKSGFRKNKRKRNPPRYNNEGFRVNQQDVVMAQPLFWFKKSCIKRKPRAK